MSVCVVGSLNFDIICRVAHLPMPGETVAGSGLLRLPGGKGANQAAAAARAGAKTIFVGAIGRDEPGDIVVSALMDRGVDVSGVKVFDHVASGHAFISVADSGENSIVLAPGANAALAPEHVVQAASAGHAVMLAQLECPIDTVAAAFQAAPGAIKILNAAPALESCRALLPLVDILIVNETELALLAGAGDLREIADISAAARGLMARPDQIVVVSLGAAGALAVLAEHIERVEGRPARAIDTTGAGDCFCGVLAAKLAEGAGLREAMVWANTAASLSVERPGALPAMPAREEIEAALGV
jgi:ribokinase